MTIYKYSIVLCLFLLACKSDSTAKVTPNIQEEPQVKEAQPKAENDVQEKLTVNESNVPSQTTKPSNEKRDTVTVSSVEQIVENARSNRVMYLEKGKYELEPDLVYYMTKDEQKIIDKRKVETRSIGGQLFFMGLDDFQIIGKNGAQIVSKNPKAVAFFVVQGKNWKISNLTIKKEVEGICISIMWII